MKRLQMAWWLLSKCWLIFSATAYVYFPLPAGPERVSAKREMWRYVRELIRIEIGL